MNMILILIIINLVFLGGFFVFGVWYGRHHREKITSEISKVHETVKDVRAHTENIQLQLASLKKNLKG